MAKQDRGFASMDPEKHRRIASEGGKAAHRKGRAHEWTPEEARIAGRKGGSVAGRAKDKARVAANPGAQSFYEDPPAPVEPKD